MTLLYKMNRLTSGRRALLCICISMLTCLGTQAAAQSQSQRKRSSDNRLDAQQYMEILGAAVRTLQTNYVDSVEWSRVLTAGIDAMLEELDPYTEFYTEEDEEDFKTMTTGEYAGVGAIIMQMGDTVCISEPYAGMPAAEAGLWAGDRILAIDGENMVKRTTGYVSEHLRGEPATSFELTFLRPGDENPRSVSVTRRKIVIDAVPYYGWLNDSVGYIQLTSFTDKAALEVQAALEKLRGEVSRMRPMAGLVFDLRGNPGGLVDEAVKIVGMFVPKGSMVVETKAKIAAWNSTYRTNTPPIDPDVRLAILIDRSSASASEITSGALQDFDRAVIMGERSYGKGLVQSTRPLPYNTMMKFTSAKYYIPSGRCIQAIDYQARRVARWEAGEESPDLGRIPDSLTHVFHTAAGREVRDGGGIKPDVERKVQYVSNLAFYLERENRFFHFANRLQGRYAEMPVVDDSIYADFCREVVTTRRDTVLSAMKIDLEHDLDSLRTDIANELQLELELRYNFRRGYVARSLKSDPLVRDAVEILADEPRYRSVLAAPSAVTTKGKKKKGK
ncbi:MAG: S41 family peptidase [Bacteroidales bacterium]|nr:S41 family peptidase [Bacteroidales bacterium]